MFHLVIKALSFVTSRRVPPTPSPTLQVGSERKRKKRCARQSEPARKDGSKARSHSLSEESEQGAAPQIAGTPQSSIHDRLSSERRRRSAPQSSIHDRLSSERRRRSAPQSSIRGRLSSERRRRSAPQSSIRGRLSSERRRRSVPTSRSCDRLSSERWRRSVEDVFCLLASNLKWAMFAKLLLLQIIFLCLGEDMLALA